MITRMTKRKQGNEDNQGPIPSASKRRKLSIWMRMVRDLIIQQLREYFRTTIILSDGSVLFLSKWPQRRPCWTIFTPTYQTIRMITTHIHWEGLVLTILLLP